MADKKLVRSVEIDLTDFTTKDVPFMKNYSVGKDNVAEIKYDSTGVQIFFSNGKDDLSPLRPFKVYNGYPFIVTEE